MAGPASIPAKPTAPRDSFAVKVNGKTTVVPRLSPDWSGKLAPTTMMQACEAAGVTVPHYCYHARLPLAGNCRMCLVEYGTPVLGPDRQPQANPDGTLRISKSPRPAIACATPVSPGMEIYTETAEVKQMRQGVLEFLLINHPLDCPICDQAGECKLQEYSLEYGQAQSRFVETKVHKPKAVDLGPRIVLDDERCILCSRCVRFTRDVVGDDALGIIHRGSYNTIAAYPGRAFDNNYTLNTVDLCPVGALTSKDFRFQMRVWFLKETKSLCTTCGTGCNILIGSRENRIYRYTPRENDAVNVCWMCDHGRLNYQWVDRPDRLKQLQYPAVRAGGQTLDWRGVLDTLAERLSHVPAGSLAIVASARQTNEELFLLKKLALHFNALTDCVPRLGEADKLLVSEDKNPNTNGARLLGLCFTEMGINLPRIVDGIRKGTIRTLLVFGEDVTRHGFTPELLGQLELLVASDILPNATTALARYLLPGCAHAEKQGTFVNVRGRVQRFLPAVDPPGDARAEWEFLRHLVVRLTAAEIPDTVAGVFNRLAQETPAFQGLTWAGLGDAGVSINI